MQERVSFNVDSSAANKSGIPALDITNLTCIEDFFVANFTCLPDCEMWDARPQNHSLVKVEEFVQITCDILRLATSALTLLVFVIRRKTL